jgi:nucleoid DNA-binding protein
MNWSSTRGKSALVKMLIKEHGFSKRKSEKAVNAVFDIMARGLRRGEIVELPIGSIQTARPPVKREKRKFQKFKNIRTREIFQKWVTYPDKIIRFKVNPRLIIKGPFAPPPPSPEMIKKDQELEQLLSQLGLPDVNDLNVKPLLGAAEGNLDWMLSRLRNLVQEERQFSNFSVLCASVRQLYWIRK